MCSQQELKQREACLDLHGCVPQDVLQDSLPDSEGLPLGPPLPHPASTPFAHPSPSQVQACGNRLQPLVDAANAIMQPEIAHCHRRGDAPSQPEHNRLLLSQGLGPHTQDFLQLRLTQGAPAAVSAAAFTLSAMKPPPPRQSSQVQPQLPQHAADMPDRDTMAAGGFEGAPGRALPGQATFAGQPHDQPLDQHRVLGSHQVPLQGPGGLVDAHGETGRDSQHHPWLPQPRATAADGLSVAPWLSVGSQAGPPSLQFSLTQGFSQEAYPSDVGKETNVTRPELPQPCHAPRVNMQHAAPPRMNPAASTDVPAAVLEASPELGLQFTLPPPSQELPQAADAEHGGHAQESCPALVTMQSHRLAAGHTEAVGVSLTMNPTRGIAPVATVLAHTSDQRTLQASGDQPAAGPIPDFAFKPSKGSGQASAVGRSPHGAGREQSTGLPAGSVPVRAQPMACSNVWALGAWTPQPLPGFGGAGDQNHPEEPQSQEKPEAPRSAIAGGFTGASLSATSSPFPSFGRFEIGVLELGVPIIRMLLVVG